MIDRKLFTMSPTGGIGLQGQDQLLGKMRCIKGNYRSIKVSQNKPAGVKHFFHTVETVWKKLKQVALRLLPGRLCPAGSSEQSTEPCLY